MLFLQRSGPGSPVTLSTLSVTNDPSGARHVTLGVTNTGYSGILLIPSYGIANRTGQWRTNLMPRFALRMGTNMMGVLPFHPNSKRLQPGESCTVTLVLPFDDLGWQASFYYHKIRRPVLDEAKELSAWIGLTKKENIRKTISTAWSDQ